MEDAYRDNEMPIREQGLVVTQLACKSHGSLLYEVSVIRDIDKYLRLDEIQVLLVSQGDDGVHVLDASERLNGSKGLLEGLELVESKMSSIDMFEIYGVWRGIASVLIVHRRGNPFLSVFVPIDLNPATRRAIVTDVRHGIALSSL